MDSKDFEVNDKAYQIIAGIIQSDASPVGIDAKKTHIIILTKLHELIEKVDRLEEKLTHQNP